METLILLLAFLSIVFIILGLYRIVFANNIEIIDRLDTFTNEQDGYSEKESVSLKEFLLGIISRLSQLLTNNTYLDKKRRKLRQAYVLMRPEEFVGISILVGLGLGALQYLFTQSKLIGILLFIIGFKIPDLFLSSLKKKRMQKLNAQLPEALNIISNGLKAGFSFVQAMAFASNELETPIRDEFKKIVKDNSIGKSMDEALSDFSDRTDDEDIDVLVTALLIQRKVGGNLTEVLDSISDTIRDRMRIRGEIQTMTAQGRFSAIIISLLPTFVAIMIFMLNPEYMMELFNHPVGIFLVVLSLIMQGIGIVIIMRLVDIEV